MLIDEVRNLRIGDPLDHQTEYGPLRFPRRIASACIVSSPKPRLRGAEILTGGKHPENSTVGFYYLPTILDRVSTTSRAVCEEIFGPVLTVERFEDEAHAIALANSTRYGLAAYLWTTKIDRALRVADRLKTAMVWVNSFFLRDLRTPFGGSRQSGLGRQGGRYGLEFWTEPKLIALAYGDR